MDCQQGTTVNIPTWLCYLQLLRGYINYNFWAPMQFVGLEIIWDANKKYCTNSYIWGQISHAPHFERGRSPHLQGRQPSSAHFCWNWWPAPFKLGRCAVVQDWSCEVFHQKYRYLGTMWPNGAQEMHPHYFHTNRVHWGKNLKWHNLLRDSAVKCGGGGHPSSLKPYLSKILNLNWLSHKKHF